MKHLLRGDANRLLDSSWPANRKVVFLGHSFPIFECQTNWWNLTLNRYLQEDTCTFNNVELLLFVLIHDDMLIICTHQFTGSIEKASDLFLCCLEHLLTVDLLYLLVLFVCRPEWLNQLIFVGTLQKGHVVKVIQVLYWVHVLTVGEGGELRITSGC